MIKLKTLLVEQSFESTFLYRGVVPIDGISSPTHGLGHKSTTDKHKNVGKLGPNYTNNPHMALIFSTDLKGLTRVYGDVYKKKLDGKVFVLNTYDNLESLISNVSVKYKESSNDALKRIKDALIEKEYRWVSLPFYSSDLEAYSYLLDQNRDKIYIDLYPEKGFVKITNQEKNKLIKELKKIKRNAGLITEELSIDNFVTISKDPVVKDVYHGTDAMFSEFDFNAVKNVDTHDNENVIYTTDSFDEARLAGSPDSTKSIIMKFQVELKKPIIVDAFGSEKNKIFGNVGYKKLIEYAKKLHCDGVIIKNIKDFSDVPQTTYILFEKNQIKTPPTHYDYEGNEIE